MKITHDTGDKFVVNGMVGQHKTVAENMVFAMDLEPTLI
jgi:hypothetical protein